MAYTDPQQSKDEENTSALILALIIVSEIIAVAFLALRFYSLSLRKQSLLLHDYLNLGGFIFATSLAVCGIIQVQYGGLGQPASMMVEAPGKMVMYGITMVVTQPLWAMGVTLVRSSILVLYLYLFSQRKWFRIACYITLGALILWNIGTTVSTLIICRPIAFNWDKTIPGGVCGRVHVVCVVSHSTNFAIALFISVLPAPVLWGLKLPRSTRIGLIVIFSLGALICVFLAARVSLSLLALTKGRTPFETSGSILQLFTIMEPLITCALACLPLLYPVAEKFAPSLFGTSGKSVTVLDTKDKEKRGSGEVLLS